MRILFQQSRRFSYRDPAAYAKDGMIYLFFTLVENAEDGQFFYVAESTSSDLLHWSKPEILTEKSTEKNHSSPGNVLKHNGYYYLCLQSYPKPNGETYGSEDSRIFTMCSKDLLHWDPPEMLMVKGDIPVRQMGRMIDPYLLDDKDTLYCFFKQNGLSVSTSSDLTHWRYQGSIAGGENVCVIKQEETFYIFHSPKNGIGLLETKNFRAFRDRGVSTLCQGNWPWAKDRITAGFIIDLSDFSFDQKFALFFHGDNEDQYRFGATLAVELFNDFEELLTIFSDNKL